MKDLKTLLKASLSSNLLDESSILADINDTLKTGDKYGNLDFNTLMNANSFEEFSEYAKLMKYVVENSAKGPFNHKQLKKGKAYMYIWQDSWSEDGYIVCFVDKYPIQDPDDDLIENAYYDINWNDYYNCVECHYDNTGNEFSNLLQQGFDGDTMKGAYEIPKEYIKSMKELIKNAQSY